MRYRTMNRALGLMGIEIEEFEPRLCFTAAGSLALPPEPTTLSNMPAESMVTADFNGDGLADLVSSRGNTLLYFRGMADGSFATAVRTTLPSEVGQLAVGKFDGNQTPDIASLARVRGTGTGTGYVGLLARVMYFDSATGTFSVGARLRLGDGASAAGERRIASGDFVSGWRDEIVVGIGSKVDIRLLNLPMRTNLVQQNVLLQNNQATLQAMTAGRNLPGAAAGRSQVVSMIGETFSSTLVLTRMNTVTALDFHDTRAIQSFATSAYDSVITGDIDGDGDADILLGGQAAVGYRTIGEVLLVRAAGGEAFDAAERILSLDQMASYESPHLRVAGLGDVNDDGRMDVVYSKVVVTDYRLVYTEFQPMVGLQDADGDFTGFSTGRSVTGPVYTPLGYAGVVFARVGTLDRPAVVQFSQYSSTSINVATTEKFGPSMGEYEALYNGTASASAFDMDPMRGGHVVRVEIAVDLDHNGIDASDPLLCELTTPDPVYAYGWRGQFTVPDAWAAGNYTMYARSIDDDGLASAWKARPFTVYG